VHIGPGFRAFLFFLIVHREAACDVLILDLRTARVSPRAHSQCRKKWTVNS